MYATELCSDRPKPPTKFVSQMLFGIQARQDGRISNIGHALGEADALILTGKRLSRNLKCAELGNL